MELAMIGLGRMGANMARRLQLGGHRVQGFDPGEAARAEATVHGITAHASLDALLQAMPAPRVVWLMIPSAVVDGMLDELLLRLAPGDTVVDGGNSWYRDTQARGERLAGQGIRYVDCGTSGGIWGLSEGYSLMVGGDEAVVAPLHPLFSTLAPAPDRGWAHVGPLGAGHYCKMIHNGIEYGMMQAYAEGFALLERKQEFNLDLAQIGEVWRHGSVVRSWLLDIGTEALKHNPTLQGIAPYVPDSGEGRWTVREAIDLDVSTPVLTLSLLERLRSREANSFADRLLAEMRNGFGGHAVRRTDTP